MHRVARRSFVPFLAAVLAAAGCGSPAERSTALASKRSAATASLPGGTSISILVNAPLAGALVASPPGDVAVSGSASIGSGGPASGGAALVVVVDASGNSVNPCGGGKTILRCELDAALALREKAAAGGAVKEMGIVIMGGGAEAFDLDAQALDASPATGVQHLVAPGADAGGLSGPDLVQVIDSVNSTAAGGEATIFTTFTVGPLTDYAAAVQRARAVLAESSQPTKLLAFFAGGPADYGDAVTSLSPLGKVVVRAFTFGGSLCSAGGAQGKLADVAALGATGSSCQEIAGTAALPDFLPAGGLARLTAIDVSVDGGAALAAAATPALPLDGPASATFGLALSGLAAGAHDLCATASGTDGGGTGTVTQCTGVRVATIALAPASAALDLGPGAHHTVTATVAAGSLGGLAGIPVTFSVVSGPNAGAGASAATGSDGTAAFDYPAKQGPAGLGTDAIRACFKDDFGTEACAEARAEWRDTTPPVVSCPPGPNPGGNVPPSNGGPNQRPDGFYRLMAVDAVDPAPKVFLVDTGSGTVFGPYASGTNIKYTQAPGGKPRAVPMGGTGSAVSWHITGTGDASLYGVDASGNKSAPVACLVPPKPA